MVLPTIRGGEVLQLLSANGGPVACGMTNIRIIPRTRRSLVRVVEQQKGQAYTKPAVASRHARALRRLPGEIHLDSLTRIIGLSGVVQGCLERFRRIPRGE